MLLSADDFGILIHQYPDGDAIGSGFALSKGLSSLGKRARVICDHEIPKSYTDIINAQNDSDTDFEPSFIISIDVASLPLLGELQEKYYEKIDLNLDHHYSNRLFGRFNYVDSRAAAAAEVAYALLCHLNVTVTKDIANCIYIGTSTDTGCFRYSNTTPRTHMIAAKMIESGADFYKINKEMFDTKSKARIMIERLALQQMDFFLDDKCAIMSITLDMIAKAQAKESDLEGLTPIPRQVKGVLTGVTIREKSEGIYKVSIRTDPSIDAGKICAVFEGGGHKCAAGCTIEGTLDEVKTKIVAEIANFKA